MVVTDDDAFAQKLRLLRNLGFVTPRFRHEVAAYNFRMTGFQAAMGVVQTKKIEGIVAEKRKMAQMYHRYLNDIPGIQLPVEKEWARNVYWMYAIVIKPEFGNRDALIKKLTEAGIETRTFFCPMNQQPFLMEKPDFRHIPCPVADSLWTNGLYLPSTHTLPEASIQYIANTIQQVYQENHR